METFERDLTIPTARLFLDEDVDVVVAAMLRTDGFVVKTVTELKRKGLSDSEQLEFAANNGLAIVTHNRRDFEELAVMYFEKGSSHSGIIISVANPPRQIADSLLDILNRFTAEELADQMIYI